MERAELILGLCDRFHCLPSALLDEDAELFRWLRLERMGRTDDD